MQAVPGKLSRYGLSQVINGLLDLSEQACPMSQHTARAATDASLAKTHAKSSFPLLRLLARVAADRVVPVT